METFRKHFLSIVITGIVIALSITLLFQDNKEISLSERRKLQKAPTFNIKDIFDKKYFPAYEDYLLDQFPFRDAFRTIKAFNNFYLLREKDNDKLYFLGDTIFKINSDFDEKQIELSIKKINGIIEKHPEAKSYYYSVIPAKNHFDKDHPHFDTKRLESLLHSKIKNAEYINIVDTLSLDDYYKSDPHWSQEKIVKVAKKLMAEIKGDYKELQDITIEKLEGYKGAYAGQLALHFPSETMHYITSPSFDGITVRSLQEKEQVALYNIDNFSHVDPYDVFLGGAKAILYIENTKADSEKELVIFRDSFSSSLAPLLVENYKKITLVDIRYISSKNADEYIDYHNADVLFLYSTELFNSGGILR